MGTVTKSSPNVGGSIGLSFGGALTQPVSEPLSEPLPVDSIITTPTNASGNDPRMWYLLTNQPDGRNGVYRNNHNGGPWDFVDLRNDRITAGGEIWSYKNGVWSNENSGRVITTAGPGPFSPAVAVTQPTEVKPQILVPTGSMAPKVDPFAVAGTVANIAGYKGPEILSGNTGIVGPSPDTSLTASAAGMTDFIKNIDPLIIGGIVLAIAAAWYFFKKRG